MVNIRKLLILLIAALMLSLGSAGTCNFQFKSIGDIFPTDVDQYIIYTVIRIHGASQAV